MKSRHLREGVKVVRETCYVKGKWPRGRKNRYKGPKVGALLVCLRRMQTPVQWEVLGDEAREINKG